MASGGEFFTANNQEHTQGGEADNNVYAESTSNDPPMQSDDLGTSLGCFFGEQFNFSEELIETGHTEEVTTTKFQPKDKVVQNLAATLNGQFSFSDYNEDMAAAISLGEPKPAISLEERKQRRCKIRDINIFAVPQKPSPKRRKPQETTTTTTHMSQKEFNDTRLPSTYLKPIYTTPIKTDTKVALNYVDDYTKAMLKSKGQPKVLSDPFASFRMEPDHHSSSTAPHLYTLLKDVINTVTAVTDWDSKTGKRVIKVRQDDPATVINRLEKLKDFILKELQLPVYEVNSETEVATQNVEKIKAAQPESLPKEQNAKTSRSSLKSRNRHIAQNLPDKDAGQPKPKRRKYQKSAKIIPDIKPKPTGKSEDLFFNLDGLLLEKTNVPKLGDSWGKNPNGVINKQPRSFAKLILCAHPKLAFAEKSVLVQTVTEMMNGKLGDTLCSEELLNELKKFLLDMEFTTVSNVRAYWTTKFHNLFANEVSKIGPMNRARYASFFEFFNVD